MHYEATMMGIDQATGVPFNAYTLLDDTTVEVTTDHAASSRGLPVVIYKGRAYSPGDLPGLSLYPIALGDDWPALIAATRAAGWAVEADRYEHPAPCRRCGRTLPPGWTETTHEDCTSADGRWEGEASIARWRAEEGQ